MPLDSEHTPPWPREQGHLVVAPAGPSQPNARYARQADGQWLRSEVEGLDGALHLVSLPCPLALTEVYRFVHFPPRTGEAQA